MALSLYLTDEEKEEIAEYKKGILDAYSINEIEFYEAKINFILDLAEKRYFTDPIKNLSHKESLYNDIGFIKVSLPSSQNN